MKTESGIKISLFKRTIIAIRHRFSLIEDKASDSQIDSDLRSGVELRGTNLWVLIFAILIASIGLNVNSTAVIIGAMLISPLMGPIMGVGYGVGIYDFDLIRKSLRNLGIATLISLIVSTLYFLISPLADAQSELLARTTPTIWDVLIALFGGLAGIIGATRSEKTNIIPGVAIATALMPPLCTVGYGLATGHWEFFFGAFYLYAINCVFIAISAVLIIWILNPAHKKFVDKATEIRVRRLLTAVVLITLLPSIYLATLLVKHELFTAKARQFINDEFTFAESHIAARNIDAKAKMIELTLIGDTVSQTQLQKIQANLIGYGLKDAQLVVKQAKDQHIDVTALKTNIMSDLYQANLVALEQKNQTIQSLQNNFSQITQSKADWEDMSAEVHTLYPEVTEVYLSQAIQWRQGEGKVNDNLILMNIKTNSKLSKDSLYKITKWLKVRSKSEHVKVIVE